MKPCGRGGYLVDATKALPTDPSVLHVEGLPVAGCSRLRCERCKASVRNVTKVSLVRNGLTDAERVALHDTADLASSALLRPGYVHFRLYLCRCSHWLETSEHSCNELEPDRVPFLHDDSETSPDEASETRPTWRCEGHPALALPQDVDGVAVASQAELRELALRGLRELLPPHVRSQDTEPGVWLARLHARLEPADASVVVSAALDSLSDSGSRTRAVALALLRRVADDSVRARVFELFDRQRALFVGVPDDVTALAKDATLEHTVWRLVGPLLAVAGGPRELARTTVLAGGANAALQEELAKRDKSWWDAKEKAARERDAALKAAAAPARALDDPRLQHALDDLHFRETLADSNDALGRFLRAAGAFAHEWYEEIDFTDWNGAIVGRGAGALIRAAIPPDPNLPYSELAPLLEMGAAARELVARHPSTPKAAPAPPAKAAPGPPVLTRQDSFALGYLPAEHLAFRLRQAQTESAGATTDPALRHAVAFARRALAIEESWVLDANAQLRAIATSAGLAAPVPTAMHDVATFLEEMAGAIALAEPSVRAAWQAGVVARDLLVALRRAAHGSYLRCAAPFDASLASAAATRASEIRKAAAAWPDSVASLGLPESFPIVIPSDLEPATTEGTRALSEAVMTLKQTFMEVLAALAKQPLATRRERLAQRFRLVRSFEALVEAIHLAEDVTTGEVVALWTYRPRSALSPEVRDSLVREALCWIDVGAHPHVVRVHEVRTEEDQLCVVSEYVAPAEGRADPSLRRMLGGPLPLPQVLALALGIARGLKAVKARAPELVHRNLRPETVLVGHDGLAKVTAFGFAAGGVERPAYMAPEEFKGRADERSEIYAFGIVVLEMLTGRRGVDADTFAGAGPAHVAGRPAELVMESQLPPPVAAWLQAALSVDPARRPGSWSAVEGQLVDLWGQVLGGAAPAPRTEDEARRAQTALGLWSRVAAADGFAELGKNEEAKARYRAAFARAAEVSEHAVEATVANNLGLVLAREGDLEGALAQLEVSLARHRMLGDRAGSARTHLHRASVRVRQHRLTEALADQEAALLVFVELGEVREQATARTDMADVLCQLGDLPGAAAMLRKCVAAFRALRDVKGEGSALRSLGQVVRRGGWLEEAHACSEAAVACFRKLGDRANEALELSSLGHTLRALGRDTDAIDSFNRSLTISEQLGDALLTGSNCFVLATMTPATPRFARLGRDLATRSAAAFRRAGRSDLAGDADALLARFTAADGRPL